jgi:transcription initiation factor TFIID subunit TAF12
MEFPFAPPEENQFIKEPTEKLAFNLLVATMGNWMKELESDRTRGINAAIRAKLRPKLKAKATADVASALNSAGPSSMEKELMDKVLKASRNEAKKTYQTIAKSTRKKSLGDAEFQESTPTKNGQSSKKKRKKQQQQQKQQEQKQQQPTSILKKGRRARFSTSPSKASSRTASQGNQGGAKRGRQRKGAARR